MKKKSRLGFLCLIFAAALILPVFSGCEYVFPGETRQTGTAEPVTAPETEEKREPIKVHEYDPDLELLSRVYLDEARGADLDGMDVFITGPSVTLLSPDGATYISKEIRERNRAVEEKLNVKLDFAEADAAAMFDDAAASVAAGMYYTDVMLLPVSVLGRFYSGALLTNLNSLPFFDLSRSYFDRGSVDAFSAGDFAMAFSADACPILSYLPALYYSRAALGSDGSLEAAAEGGTLTWDTVLAAAKEGAEALGGGAYPFSVGAVGQTLPETVFASLGGKTVSSEGEKPFVSIAEDILSLSSAVVSEINGSSPARDKNGAAFKKGTSVFHIDYVGSAGSLHSLSVDWGILPVPTGKAGGAAKSLVSPDCPVFTVVAGTKNSEEISLVLTALCAASYGVIPEHYVDEVIVTSMRDDGSGRMLDLIRKTAVFDLSAAVASESETIMNGTLGAIREAGSEAGADYAALAAAADAELQRIFE